MLLVMCSRLISVVSAHFKVALHVTVHKDVHSTGKELIFNLYLIFLYVFLSSDCLLLFILFFNFSFSLFLSFSFLLIGNNLLLTYLLTYSFTHSHSLHGAGYYLKR